MNPNPVLTQPPHSSQRSGRHPLDVFFRPRTVAVVGATEAAGSVGRTILWNLLSNPFGGMVFPVNPKRQSVLGIKAYPKIADVPAAVDLAVVVVAAPIVPQVIGECAAAGVEGAIIISAGFKEAGPQGAGLEQQVLDQARRGRMRLIGPNCLGVMNPMSGLNATFAGAMARPGNVAFISQSGALCTAILDWSLREFVGFSAFVSIGSMLDVGWGDLIDYLGNDPQTHSIVIYMESVGDARSFLSAAREVALAKPVIVIKVGRTEAAARAAASHTGALTGSDEILDAAFHRCGVLRVNTIADLFYMADVLSKQPRPKGPRLAVITNAGGPGVLATDALIASGGELAQLAPATIESLNQILPAHWSHANPVDVLGDASPEQYVRAVDLTAQDPNADGLLVILSPQAMTDPTQTAEQLKARTRWDGKPILASWMGGAQVEAGAAILNRANIPAFPFPDTAARIFQYMWQYSYNLRGLYETPSLPGEDKNSADPKALASQIIQAARGAGRTLLTETESKNVLAAYGIPCVETRLATAEDEAAQIAAAMGYPVALKLYSTTITHKTDVGGVQLNLKDEAAVRSAYHQIQDSVHLKAGPGHFEGVSVQRMVCHAGYELILGSTIDPQFGPVLLFGAGGQLVEVFRDHALALPPLNSTLARRMMERTRVYKALQGVRGRASIHLAGLESLLVRFSQLVAEQRAIREIDVNPLLASAEELLALDARVVLHPPELGERDLPTLAIRPYPNQYAGSWVMKDGTPVTIRPIRPEDEPLMVRFHQDLSERTVYLRYFGSPTLGYRVAHERLTRICFIDYDREIALVAEQGGEDDRKIIGVGRLTKARQSPQGEFAVLVSDLFQGKGLGAELLRRLIEVARDEKLDRLAGQILSENIEMQRLCSKLGMHLRRSAHDPTIEVSLDLR